MKSFFSKILAGILATFLAIKFIPGVSLQIFPGKTKFLSIVINEKWQLIILIGIIFGLINFFLKPILKLITFPFSLLTMGFFSLLINLALVKLVDLFFLELEIKGFLSLISTTALVWVLELILK